MKHANEYGFLPGNDAEQNARALQAVVDLGGEILVELPGVYDLSETVEIGDDTSIRFSEGVKIRRQKSRTGKTGMLFLNKGCDTLFGIIWPAGIPSSYCSGQEAPEAGPSWFV